MFNLDEADVITLPLDMYKYKSAIKLSLQAAMIHTQSWTNYTLAPRSRELT